jgi:hypothetical protein
MREKDEHGSGSDNFLIAWLKKVLNVHPEWRDNERWRKMENGEKFFTPAILVLVSLGAIDVVFATPQGRIRLVVHRLQPWRIAGYLSWAGRRFSAEPLDAWELPAGRCAVLSLVPGDHIRRLFDVAHPSIGMTGRA